MFRPGTTLWVYWAYNVKYLCRYLSSTSSSSFFFFFFLDTHTHKQTSKRSPLQQCIPEAGQLSSNPSTFQISLPLSNIFQTTLLSKKTHLHPCHPPPQLPPVLSITLTQELHALFTKCWSAARYTSPLSDLCLSVCLSRCKVIEAVCLSVCLSLCKVIEAVCLSVCRDVR